MYIFHIIGKNVKNAAYIFHIFEKNVKIFKRGGGGGGQIIYFAKLPLLQMHARFFIILNEN